MTPAMSTIRTGDWVADVTTWRIRSLVPQGPSIAECFPPTTPMVSYMYFIIIMHSSKNITYLECVMTTIGVSKVRKSVTGTDLPSARLISSKVLDSQSQLLNNDTLFTMQWGQFLDHDIALTKVIANGSLICFKLSINFFIIFVLIVIV